MYGFKRGRKTDPQGNKRCGICDFWVRYGGEEVLWGRCEKLLVSEQNEGVSSTTHEFYLCEDWKLRRG